MKMTAIHRIPLILTLLFNVCYLSSVAQAAEIEKALLYDKYTLNDSYSYKDTTRRFQWDKIRQKLDLIDTLQTQPAVWGVLQNYKNLNGEPPLVKNYHRNEYRRVVDAFNIERSQGIPMYAEDELTTPVRYGQDGDLIKIIEEKEDFIKVENIYLGGVWMIPKKYVHPIMHDQPFNKVIMIDRTNQNIAVLEKVDAKWLIRSMNPATTGLHRPPYEMSTPVGIFVLQEKRSKMYYYKDGTTEIAGFAPNANRFSTGAYIHGVPINYPRQEEIEYSATLGTTPRSHKCVRNATSHAKFIYDWAPIEQTLVVVID
jgi:hypothetical protein